VLERGSPAKHLDDSIVTGVSCCYEPLTNIVWTT